MRVGPIRKAEHPRIHAFELWCWRRLLRVLWTARRSNQYILKEISPKYSSEGLMLKWKLQYFGHLMRRLTHWKRPWCWESLKAGEGDDRGWDGWMASPTQWTRVWETPGNSEGQGIPACCSPWGRKESETTEQLKNNCCVALWNLWHFTVNQQWLIEFVSYILVNNVV